jgi:hypothetical protein
VEEATFASQRKLATDKGDRGGACGGGAAWTTCGGREEQVAQGSPAGTATRRRHDRDRRSVRAVALGRAQFTVHRSS